MEQYRDIFGFTPLEPALDELLISLIDEVDGQEWFERFGISPMYKELEKLGYLSHISAYLDGKTGGVVTDKGIRYVTDKAAWECRYNEWTELLNAEKAESERKRLEERVEDKRHDWKINTVNGVYAIVSAVVGGLVGYVLGILS